MDDGYAGREEPRKLSPKRKLLLVVFLLLFAISGIAALWLNSKDSNELPAVQPAPIIKLKTPDVKPNFVATGLDSPTTIVATQDTADKRLFVTERGGAIRVVDASGKLEAQPFLDIKSKVLSNSELGLLGLAFHPKYAQNGYFYINYIDKDQNTTISRFNVSSQSGLADPGSEKVLFKLKQPYANHNGGALVFGHDGYLYAALGDGGSAGDPENRAQNKDSYFGKILRIDVDKGDPYSVPVNNPFAGQTGVKPEIWAYGLRNPWRISFDKLTNELYIADVGQGTYEEVDVQKADSKGGENYGWRCYEGSHTFKTDGCPASSSFVTPVFDYTHEEGRCSITGGYVYRGTKNPALTGKYFYGDYCSGDIFYGENKDGKWSQVLAVKTPYAISTFGQGSDGELYFADFKTGTIYKIQDVGN